MPVITLAHSPDADDMVMFWPLTGLRDADGEPYPGDLGKPAIDCGEFEFQTVADDVEALNRLAIEEAQTPSDAGRTTPLADRSYDISAISAATYPFVKDVFAITACGGSFGEGYGPKVVARRGGVSRVEDLAGRRVAIPGRRTTAFMTLSIMLGDETVEPVEMLFSEIPGAVERGEVDAGLLIHEAQLLLDEHGLTELADVGAWWSRTSGLALPLGLNVIRRDLDERFGDGAVSRISALLQASVVHARTHAATSRRLLLDRAGDRAEWKDEALVQRYLDMYVSDMTVDMGEPGRKALTRLFAEASHRGLCPDPGEIEIV